MLLVTPFTIPKKLRHRRECLYQIGYLLVNVLSGIGFVLSLGLMEFTMVFGLPVYWLVVPSAYCAKSTNPNTPA